MTTPAPMFKYVYMPEFGQEMYQRYTPSINLNVRVDDTLREFIWWEVSVCDTLSGNFQEYTWIPMGVPVKGVA